jgi:hypothetical protein
MEWEQIFNFLHGFDIQNIISFAAIVYFSKSSTDKKIEKLSDRIDSIDKRLCRIEGALSAKECCMLSHDKHEKLAE